METRREKIDDRQIPNTRDFGGEGGVYDCIKLPRETSFSLHTPRAEPNSVAVGTTGEDSLLPKLLILSPEEILD